MTLNVVAIGVPKLFENRICTIRTTGISNILRQQLQNLVKEYNKAPVYTLKPRYALEFDGDDIIVCQPSTAALSPTMQEFAHFVDSIFGVGSADLIPGYKRPTITSALTHSPTAGHQPATRITR